MTSNIESSEKKVYFSSCSSYAVAEVQPALAKVLDPLVAEIGEISGKKVLLKPNWLSYRCDEDPASVHPEMVVETARYLLNAGAASVTVMETPGMEDVYTIANRMKLPEKLAPLGVEIKAFKSYQPIEAPEGAVFRRLEVARDYLDFDLVVNLAKGKTHCMMTLTMAVKNLFGLVRGAERIAWHLSVGNNYERFADMLLDLYLVFRPQINIVDAVVCMEGNGPGSGDPVRRDFIAASGDALAIDSVLAEIFGAPDIPQLKRARERGLIPATSLEGDIPEVNPFVLPPESDAPGSTGIAFGIPEFLQKPLRRFFVANPVLNAERCIGCGICVKVCPPHSLSLAGKKQKKASFHLSSCIRC
jgi:uncharacterized protein (DUF362 family)